MSPAKFQRRIAAYRHDDPRRPCRLAQIDPGAQTFSKGGPDADEQVVQRLARRLASLQEALHAQRRHRVLVILQGMDASGKDGAVRHVFGAMSALGVRAVSWEAPTAQEQAHDPLWRIHQAVPAAGELVIFNRSHYEDVIEPVVHGQLKGRRFKERCTHINDFERMLAETGTTLCKFFLHISKDEQRRRLQARLEEPSKRWKFDPEDLQARKRWKTYQQCYASVIQRTGTPWAPWYVVPADLKPHRDLMVSMVLEQLLVNLKLRYPAGKRSWKRVEVR